jgi:HEAT repeat protein
MTKRQIAAHLGGLIVLIGLLTFWYWSYTGARAVPGLTVSLTDEQPKVRVAAAQALGQIGPASRPAVPALLNQALHDPIEYAAGQAALALKTIDLAAARQVMTAYLPALEEQDVNLRRNACSVLANLGPVAKPAVPALTHALSDSDEIVRARVVSALGEIGIPAKDVVPALATALHDTSPQVRHAAATKFAFSMAPSADAIPALTEASKSSDMNVAFLAKTALGRVKGEAKNKVSVLIIILKQGSSKDYAMHQLAEMGPSAVEAVPDLIPSLKDDRALHRYLAAEALQAMGPQAREATPALIVVLQDDDPVVRDSAAEALEAIGSPEAQHAVAMYRSQSGSR